jgi:hypothetical protein
MNEKQIQEIAEEMVIRYGFATEHKVQVWEANAAIKNAVLAALRKIELSVKK